MGDLLQRPPSKKGRRALSLLPKPNADKVLKLKHSKKKANKARDATAREGINGQDDALRAAFLASNKVSPGPAGCPAHASGFVELMLR